MDPTPLPSHLFVPAGSPLRASLTRLADTRRLVFFAGVPGTGKSLLTHQLAHLAHTAGRTVHLLQWDTARPAFEASPAGRRYPVVGGVTHPVVRKSAGLWTRRALIEWEARHPDPGHLLVGETPLVGHRFIELARPIDDDAEPLLAGSATCFVIPVLSPGVRQFLVAERERRAAHPLHPREREDAPPQVLRELWREVASVATRLGIAPVELPGAEAPDHAVLYQRVYQHVLRYRHTEVLPIDTRLPTETLSVYDFAMPRRELVPTAEEADAAIREVEAKYPDLDVLRCEVDAWWAV